MSLTSDDNDYDSSTGNGIAFDYDSDSVAYSESEWAEDPLQVADYTSPLTQYNPLFDEEVLDQLRSLIERATDHYKRYGYAIQTTEYAVALRLAQTFSQMVKAMNYRYAYYDNRMRCVISRNRNARIELRNLVTTQAEELALLRRRFASELVEVATPVPNHPQTLPREEAATGPGPATSGHGTPNVATSRLSSSLSLSHTHNSDRAQYQDRALAVHLELRDAVGKLRLTVASAFASLFPNTSFLGIPINRLNGGIIWDTFLVCLKKHYHKHVTVQKDKDGNPVEGQAYSVFREFATVSDSDEKFPCTQLSASDWKTISKCFVPHWVPHSLRRIEAAHRRNEDLKLMFRLFVPLFIWAYNECKLWLIFTEEQLIRYEDFVATSPDCAYVFKNGSALDVRCHFNEREDEIYQSLTKIISGAVDRAIQTVGEDSWDEDLLRSEHSKLLIKFNKIRKCLNILVDDALLDLLLSHDATLSLYRRRSHNHVDDSVKLQMESLAMEKIYNDDVFSAEDKTIHEKKLIEVNDCLRDVNHYHGNAILSTEQRIDSFVEHAFLIRVGSEDHPKQCHDYTILRALLRKLLPSDYKC